MARPVRFLPARHATSAVHFFFVSSSSVFPVRIACQSINAIHSDGTARFTIEHNVRRLSGYCTFASRRKTLIELVDLPTRFDVMVNVDFYRHTWTEIRFETVTFCFLYNPSTDVQLLWNWHMFFSFININ